MCDNLYIAFDILEHLVYYMDVLGVLLDKETEVLEMMIEHGIMERLCDIFCTCQDEDTIVWMVFLL